MSDSFVPEADSLDQHREVAPAPVPDPVGRPALEYPARMPFEAAEADVIEQEQVIDDEDDRR